MKLIKQVTMSGTEQHIDLAGASLSPADHIKIFAAGDLSAQAADRRFLLRLNGLPTGYQSFVVMDGHYHTGEWDGSGFYVGRNGWYLDASVTIEYTISAAMNQQQKRLGHGLSTFGLGNNSILGYQCNGFLVTDKPIQSVSLIVTGGVFSGALKVYSF